MRQKGIQQTYGKEKGRFPYQYWRTGADRGNTYAWSGEGRNCGPFTGGPGHQGDPAQIRQGQLPHFGRSHSAGRGDVHRLHDHRRQGTDVLGGLLPGGRGCQAGQAGGMAQQARAGGEAAIAAGGLFSGTEHRSHAGAVHAAAYVSGGAVPRHKPSDPQFDRGRGQDPGAAGVYDPLLQTEGRIPGVLLPRRGAQNHFLL